MYLSAVYTLADRVLDWKGIGAGIAHVTRKPVDVVNNDDPDPHAVADMVLARGNVLDACTSWATGVWQAAHPRAGGFAQSQRIVERADYGLDALTGHETREAGPRGIDPTG